MRFSQFFFKSSKNADCTNLNIKSTDHICTKYLSKWKKNQGKNMHDNLSSCADIAGNQ